MRRVKAKALRKASTQIANNTEVNVRHVGYRTFEFLKDGVIQKGKVPCYTASHAEGSFRRVYQELKEHYKKLPRNARGIMVI